jgi:hypothetical protein
LPHWTIYALRHPTPILTADQPAPGVKVLEVTDTRIRLWLPAAGGYDLRFNYSPYWSADAAGICLSPTATGMTHIRTAMPGPLTMEFEPTLATMAATATSQTPACTT